MAGFKLFIDAEEEIVVNEDTLLAFRFYERLSGLEPTLDKSQEQLHCYSPEDTAPPSPFNLSTVYHTPPVLGHEPKVQPPYYIQALIAPSVIEDKFTIDELLGRPARLEITDETGPDTRHIHGIILRALERNSPYGTANAIEVQIYPWIWATSLSEKSRVWSDANSVTVLDALIDEYQPEFPQSPGVSKPGLSSEPGLRESVVQWQESDFELLSRLLERDGVYYFFNHDDTSTTIMLADSKSPYGEDYLPNRTLTFHPTMGPGSELFDDHISFITTQVQTIPRSYHVADYNPLLADIQLDYVVPLEAKTALRIYDFPGDVAAVGAAPDAARRRYTAVTAREKIVLAASRSPFISAGHATTIAGESSDEDQVIRVTQAVHELVRDTAGKPFYRNWFEGIEGTSYYAPTQRTPVPSVYGTHNAIVVSSLDDETVDIDADNRALVVFRWDQGEEPVRVRLGSPWAGSSHGATIFPRAGDEVLIAFIQGNTERPLILTSLYNSSNTNNYNATQMVTSSLSGTEDADSESRQGRYSTALNNTTGNQILFNDTLKKELVKIDAYKDFVLEIGHKITTSVATTSSTSITNSTTSTGTYSALSTGTGTFETDKASRGTGLLRAYGDFSIYVGKYGAYAGESDITARGSKDALSVIDNETATLLDQSDRGDFNLFVMGGTTKVVLGRKAFVKSPFSGALKAAEYDRVDVTMGEVKTAYSNPDTEASISVSESISFSAAWNSSTTFGLDTDFKVAGDMSTSIGMSVSQAINLLSIGWETGDLEVKSVLYKSNAEDVPEHANALQTVQQNDAVLDAATKAITGYFETAAAISAAATTAAATTIFAVSTSKLTADNEDDVDDFMTGTFPEIGKDLQLSQTILYGMWLLAGAVYLTTAKLSSGAGAFGISPFRESSIAVIKTAFTVASAVTITPLSAMVTFLSWAGKKTVHSMSTAMSTWGS